jgi:hypothetical protein
MSGDSINARQKNFLGTFPRSKPARRFEASIRKSAATVRNGMSAEISEIFNEKRVAKKKALGFPRA